jgi:hypothetical protein
MSSTGNYLMQKARRQHERNQLVKATLARQRPSSRLKPNLPQSAVGLLRRFGVVLASAATFILKLTVNQCGCSRSQIQISLAAARVAASLPKTVVRCLVAVGVVETSATARSSARHGD